MAARWQHTPQQALLAPFNVLYLSCESLKRGLKAKRESSYWKFCTFKQLNFDYSMTTHVSLTLYPIPGPFCTCFYSQSEFISVGLLIFDWSEGSRSEQNASRWNEWWVAALLSPHVGVRSAHSDCAFLPLLGKHGNMRVQQRCRPPQSWIQQLVWFHPQGWLVTICRTGLL